MWNNTSYVKIAFYLQKTCFLSGDWLLFSFTAANENLVLHPEDTTTNEFLDVIIAGKIEPLLVRKFIFDYHVEERNFWILLLSMDWKTSDNSQPKRLIF